MYTVLYTYVYYARNVAYLNKIQICYLQEKTWENMGRV